MNSNFQIRIGLASCGIAAGANSVLERMKEETSGLSVEITSVGCLGMCYCEPLVELIDQNGSSFLYGSVSPDDATRIVKEHIVTNRPVTSLLVSKDLDCLQGQTRFALANCGIINPEDIDSYIAASGYQGFITAVTTMSPEQVIEEVKEAGLRGRGGAGFPTHLKWSLTRKALGEKKYIVCNADEGDPGAFMDRSLLESDPHSVIEGILLAGYAVGATNGIIYVRAEYPLAVKRLAIAIDKARQYGLLGKGILGTPFSFDISLREGAGAFVCGEETALLMSIEGKRGMPRPRPPYPAEKGLFGYPTCINNVETLANVARITRLGAAEFAQYGTKLSKGTKVFALAGKVSRGGLVEIPMGTTINELVFTIGGGIPGGKQFKAIQTGGPSGGCVPSSLGETPVDYESLGEIGAIMGSGGLLVMDEETCMVNIAKYFLQFAKDESCGKCSFCRVGTEQMLMILNRITTGEGDMEDLDTLEELALNIQRGSLCGLGQTAPNPVLTTLKYFRDEYEAHIHEKVCPARQCKSLIEYQIDSAKCRRCGLCVRECPVKAISNDRQEGYRIDLEHCLRCGLCLSSCKFEAIVIQSKPKLDKDQAGVGV